MTLGERCDEIVRLIDETLEDYAVSIAGVLPAPLAEGGTVAERPLTTRVRTLAQMQRERLARTA